jgi:hypothetical protein
MIVFRQDGNRRQTSRFERAARKLIFHLRCLISIERLAEGEQPFNSSFMPTGAGWRK